MGLVVFCPVPVCFSTVVWAEAAWVLSAGVRGEVVSAFSGLRHSQAKFSHPLPISFLLLKAAFKINGEGGKR